MTCKILVNVAPFETRAAIIKDTKLTNLFYEIDDSEKIVGCIFKGRVSNVVPGTQSAFVDIGIHKDAYLTLQGVESSDNQDLKDIFKKPIQLTLKVGQEVVIQILKEPTPTKGPRSTMSIAFPGRYLIFMPKESHIGISRKITNEKERDRLRQIAQNLVPEGTGIIFRTASEGLEESILKSDLNLLIKMWQKVEKKINSSSAPRLIHRDIPLPMKVARDFFNDEVDEMIVDSKEAYNLILEDCDFLSPMQRASLEYYSDKEPLFKKYAIEKDIEIALSKKIWLVSGGYIFIEKTEAMYCIDVNSGRFSGGDNLEETVFKVNQEAAKEIARQIILRNLSGMIVVDFIDMETAAHKSQVLKTLKNGLKNDTNKGFIHDFSELGLVQITRRRTSASLDETLKTVCPCCHGTGKTLSISMLANKIKTLLIDESQRYETEKITVTAHKSVIDHISGPDRSGFKELEKLISRKILIKSVVGFDLESYSIEPVLDKNKDTKKKTTDSN